MQRSILHSDMNNFYASVECLYHPELKNRPVAVGSRGDSRYGVILAKNYLAKRYGVSTGEAIWKAKNKCPKLVILEPNFDLYIKFSKMAISIYKEYTDLVESFGLDECWLDVTQSHRLFGDAEEIADNIRKRIKRELGLTVSIGVSFNKIFAKLGSDMRKPDTTTVISEKNFKEKIWNLPVEDLLNVGRATKKKFIKYNIMSIGDLANSDKKFIKMSLGKRGEQLWNFANGYDRSLVLHTSFKYPVKSIGNSITTSRYLKSYEEVKIVLYKLVESVSERLREYNFACGGVQLVIRDDNFITYERQATFNMPSTTTKEIFLKAFELFKKNHNPFVPVRKIGISVFNLYNFSCFQLCVDKDFENIQKYEKLDKTIDRIRGKFGYYSIQRAISLVDVDLSNINLKDEHIIHPVSYYSRSF